MPECQPGVNNLCLRHPGIRYLLLLHFFNHMDTISRENNSMLPIGGVIVGAIALALGLYSTVSLSKVKTQLAAQQEKVDKIDDIAAQVSAASSKADSVKASLDSVAKQTQDAFTAVGNSIGTMQAQLAKIEEARRRPARASRGGEAVVAGPGEYVIKSGDTRCEDRPRQRLLPFRSSVGQSERGLEAPEGGPEDQAAGEEILSGPAQSGGPSRWEKGKNADWRRRVCWSCAACATGTRSGAPSAISS